MRFFLWPSLISLSCFVAVFAWGGWPLLLITVLLTVLEITLSFDNAVVNARVLSDMDERWRRRFLTWGIIVAVFGTRLVFPIFIVSLTAFMPPHTIAALALFDPKHYGELLEAAHPMISAFGAMFLGLVALKYFFDESKHVHWIAIVEKRLAQLGRIEAIELVIALAALLAVSVFSAEPYPVLAAGIVGIITFVCMRAIIGLFSVEGGHAVGSGLALFVYLNVLDSAFSLDGVVGAFAISSDLLAIVVGLGIGALFVRSITVYLVEKRSLHALVFLEHGAHWAIFGLAASMLLSLLFHIPEAFTALIGFSLVAVSLLSSVRHRHLIASREYC